MHADGNIQYANYQSEQQVIDYLTANGYDETTFGDWFGGGATSSDAGDSLTFVNVADSEKSVPDTAIDARPARIDHTHEVHLRPVDEWQAEFFG